MVKKASKPRQAASARRMVQIPLWLAILYFFVLILLALWLWTSQREHGTRVRVREVDNFEEALPSIAGMTGGVIQPGNRVEVLQNGDQFFPAFLADIAAARETVHVETYVWWQGEICGEVARALAARARDGLEVRLTIDAVGSMKADNDLLDEMEKAGVKVSQYHPLRLGDFGLFNNRTHRKLAIFDGRVAYVFGHGIAGEWTGRGQDAEHWRDTGVRLTGPVVSALQSAFAENWVEQTGEALVGPRYFPRITPSGPVRAHVVASSPHGGVSDQETLFKIAIATARRDLLIQNPYFIPDLEVVELLGRAVKRGVDVRIMLPGPVTDSAIVKHASHFYFEDLLERGVRIYVYRRTLLHQKIAVVDGLWSLVGSTNFDDRSFDINDEVSVGMIDPAVAAELARAFKADLRDCREVRLDAWRRRGFVDKGLDVMSYALNGQL